MSLRIWLPLNGNLNNQGLDNIAITNNGVTFVDGKIGKAGNFSGEKYLTLSSGVGITENSDFSCCYWVKELSNNTTSQFRVVYQYGNLIVGQYGSALDIYNAGASGLDVTTNIDSTKWVHCAFTYKHTNKEINIYVNGELKKTSTISSIPTYNTYCSIGRRNNGTTLLDGYINDFRIYDHCLSVKEVKEISKALTLHYRLSGIGQENLAKNTNESITATATSTSSTWGACNKYWNHGIPIEPNQTYTLSFDYEFDWANVSETDHSGIGCGIGSGDDGTLYQSDLYAIIAKYQDYGGSTDKGHFVYHLKAVTNPSQYQRFFAFRLLRYDGLNYNGVKITISNFKLERGDIDTPWCPNPSEELYSIMGLNDNIEYDCSGFGYNGEKTKQFISTYDTPRYSSSYIFNNDCSEYINRECLYHLLSCGGTTWSCWVKQINRNSTSNGKSYEYQYILSSGRDYLDGKTYGMNISITNGVPRFIIGTKTIVSSMGAIPLNEWHLITATWDGNTAKLFIDGVFSKSDSVSSTTFDNCYNRFVIGKMSYGYTVNNVYFPFVGNISDVRIYSTALSSDDILELYNTSAWINENSIAAYELLED